MIKEKRVRRLTPLECCRLQGFPDYWCEDLKDDDMTFWRVVFDEYARITGTARKSDARIKQWIADPKSDAAEYKMWGNGVALPCVTFVMDAIVRYEETRDETQSIEH